MSQPASTTRVHFFNLDVLRFVAVFMVVIFHGYLAYTGWFGQVPFLASSADPKKLSFTGAVIEKLVMNFDLGVDLFFLISGFLITYLLLQEREARGRIRIGNFYLRRALRIWPLYFLVIALTPWLVWLTGEQQPDYTWTALFMNNFYTIFKGHGDFPFFHFWSVCVEEHFYLVWPLVIAFCPVRKMPLVFAIVIFASLFFRAYIFLASPDWYLHASYNTLSKMDVLAIGSWLGYRHFVSPVRLEVPGAVRLLGFSAFVFLLCVESSHSADSLFMVCFKKYFFVGGFLFLFSNYMFNPGALFFFTKKNVFHYLGKISYGIYMYHNILFPFIVKKIMWPYGSSSFYLFVLIYGSLVLLLSIVSYELFEKRILRFKDRFAIIKTYR